MEQVSQGQYTQYPPMGTNPSGQPSNAAGRFEQHHVHQGYGNPYARQFDYDIPDMPMAHIKWKDREVSIPAPTLNKMEENLTAAVQRTQENNMYVAVGVLKSAVLAFLGFESAFKTLLSKGDDNTLLYILEKCISELNQANMEQGKVGTHEFSFLVTNEDPIITNFRELCEHCIKIINEMLPLLQGRKTAINQHEAIKQVYGWTGWKQQAQQIKVSNSVLGRLIEKMLKETPENSIYKEVRCFQQSVAYILNCFSNSSYPDQKTIQNIYERNGFVLFDEYSHPLESIEVHDESENSQVAPERRGWFS